MKKILVVLLLFIVIPSAFADWFYNSQYITVNVDISSDAEIVPLTPSGYIESATVNMTFFPQQTLNQQLLKFHTEPLAELQDKILKFTWEKPEDRIEFSLNSDVKIASVMNKVSKKINFPLEGLPETVIAYTKPSVTIDSDNNDIVRLASNLAKGEDDLYVAVFKIAEWTKNNIEYNLSTLTAEVSQKASWVLANKQGVCDELTSLFISMLRALGVPARFVSGIAYTDSPLFPEKWGPHGWAEVYFPGYGWIPFDVTYGEFGWVDPTHVKFKDSLDPDEPSTYYQWLGSNVDLRTKKLDIKANLLEKQGYSKILVNLEASPLKKAVGFGSYNLIEATIENPNNFYYATDVYLSKPREIKVIGSETKSVLLLPGETKKVFWIVKVDDDLDGRYSYTFPIIASTLNNVTSKTSFVSNIREDQVSFGDIEPIAKNLEEEKEKKYSGNVMITCEINKTEFYIYENASFSCDVKNSGNIFLSDVDVCFEDNCRKTDLGISQMGNFTFKIDTSKIGFKNDAITLKNGLVSKSFNLDLKINDIPKIGIEQLKYPVNVSYDENFTVYFAITKKSLSNPKNAHIVLDVNGIQKSWDIDELKEDRKFAVRFYGNQLKFGDNIYKINVDYYDGLNKHYTANKKFSIRLPKANFNQKFVLAVNAVGGIFERIGYETISLMLFAVAIAFIITIWLLFRKKREEE